MRVLSGTARGVPLKTVPDFQTRPILDRVKKSLFSILDSAGLLLEARVLDLYAGTGTQGIEALSRGARFCHLVEARAVAVKLLHENLHKTRLADRALVTQGYVLQALETLSRQRKEAQSWEPFDLVLSDPPFALSASATADSALLQELTLAGDLLAPHGRLVLRAEKKTVPPQVPGLTLARHWTDGPHALCFYAPEAAQP